MVVKGRLKKGEYYDSVALMIVGRELSKAPGVADAAVVMGTKENLALLRSSGLMLGEFEKASDADLLVAVKAENADAADLALQEAEERMRNSRGGKGGAEAAERPAGLEDALKVLPGANLALISVAGRYAGEEAMKALRAGLHVMLFSDNVPLETEVALKEYARGKGLLVMGPDCGTAIINGVPLAFANVVRRGDVGLVAAAGTGLQEVSSTLSNLGAGVSQAVGTGGRDVKKEVGGIMLLEGFKALAADEATRVIVLVSKPPHEEVLRRLAAAVRGVKKPVVAVFLGADAKLVEGAGMVHAATLEEAAYMAAALARGSRPESVRGTLAERDKEVAVTASAEAARILNASKGTRAASADRRAPRFVRGLFSGGTFCTEAQVVFRAHGLSAFSNVPLAPNPAIKDLWKSREHCLLDLGDDAFTVGRPHPMIDFGLRCKRILQEARDPETAVILLDVVLGWGSNIDPAGELVPVLREARKTAEDARRRLLVVCSVTGTEGDPQTRSKVEKRLKEAGALVLPTNAAACRLAAGVAAALAPTPAPAAPAPGHSGASAARKENDPRAARRKP